MAMSSATTPQIEERSIITDEEAKEVKIALIRLDRSLKGVAEEDENVSYSGVTKALNGDIRCYPAYAEFFNRILEAAHE